MAVAQGSRRDRVCRTGPMSFRSADRLPIIDPDRRSDDHEADRHDDAERGRRVPRPRRPDEDRRGRFERGGWTAPFGDEEGWRFVTSMFERGSSSRRR